MQNLLPAYAPTDAFARGRIEHLIIISFIIVLYHRCWSLSCP